MSQINVITLFVKPTWSLAFSSTLLPTLRLFRALLLSFILRLAIWRVQFNEWIVKLTLLLGFDTLNFGAQSFIDGQQLLWCLFYYGDGAFEVVKDSLLSLKVAYRVLGHLFVQLQAILKLACLQILVKREGRLRLVVLTEFRHSLLWRWFPLSFP